jgi:hypothetical protein
MEATDTIVCPFCNTNSHFTKKWDAATVFPLEGGQQRRQAAMQCDRCNRIVGAIGPGDGRMEEYWPGTVGGKDFPDVPTHLAEAADEAHRCRSINALRAAVAMARAVVEATAKDKGVDTGNLMTKIDALATAGVISEAMKDAAHEIRFAGNEAAHGDLAAGAISEEDALEVLGLMDAILLRVYQEPAQVERVRQRRLARKSGNT